MDNLFEFIRNGLHFNKFEVGELVFVEYSCPLEAEKRRCLVAIRLPDSCFEWQENLADNKRPLDRFCRRHAVY